MVAQMEIASGGVIKGYELHEQIGAGGFGVVYRAYQSAIGREVAVKIILPSLANRPDFIRRFETEAQLIARLEHPYIIPLYDYWRDPNGAYLVTRFLRGGSLHTTLKEGPFEPQAAAMLLDQITSALAVAHRNQVIHRDLKPANILMDEDGNAYLADFGIAKDLANLNSSHTQPEAIVGSLDYLSPEQARSEPVTPQTDIYSMGIILFEMLTGEHPFPGSSAVDRLYKHLNEPLPKICNSLPPEVLEHVNAIIQKATDKNPARRYPDALTLAQAFREAAGLSYARDGDRMVELLTQREQEILQLIIAGRSNREIAEELVVTVGTIKWYIRQIYSKLHVRSRVQAIVRARELNLIVTEAKPTSDTSMKPGISSLYLPEPENPYKGLRAFQSADHRDFFGREALTQKLVKRLDEKNDQARFMAVVGPSGSGKSSLVRAGLIPALWRGELQASDRWFITEMLPGAHPLDELEIALMRIATEHSANIKEQLQRDTRGLVRATQLVLPNDGSELVLVIDQFEEVFTLVKDEATRVAFLDLLYTAVTDPRSRVRVVITLRADFYDRPLLYADFGELVRSRMETILPLTADELERAIARPAEQVGVTFEPGLVSSIVAEVNYQPGALPLLQYALTELFEQRQERLLTHEVYQSIGGTVGALARRADEIYEGLDEAGQETARQMFLRLVTLGEGVEDTRRRVARDELMAIAADKDVMDDVIDTYATYRLLSLDHDPGTRTPTVEVAHEAILREWKRLRGWLNDSRQEIRLQRQLAAMAAEWHTANQDSSFLVRGARLEHFERWMRDTRLALTQLERSYLDTSLIEREKREMQESQRQEREATLERRSRRFLQMLVAVFALATLIAIGLTVFAFDREAHAQANFTRAERIRLASQAQIALGQGEDLRVPALLALRSLALGYSAEADSALLMALRRGISQQIYVGHVDALPVAIFSPDRSHVVTAAQDGTVRLWDTQSGRELRQFIGHSGLVNQAVFLPDGEYVVSSGPDGTVRQWDISTGEEVHRLLEQSGPVLGLAVSPDGRYIATSDDNGTAHLWELESMALVREFSGHTDAINRVAFSPDGYYLATGSFDRTARVWEVATGEEAQRFEGHAGCACGVAFSSDGSLLLTAGYDSTVRLWDVPTGQELRRFIGHTNLVRSAEFSPDDRLVVSASIDKTVRLWDVETGQELRQLLGHTAEVSRASFSADGQFVLSAGSDRTARLWDLSVEIEPRVFQNPFATLHANTVAMAELSDDNTNIITANGEGTIQVWNVRTGQVIHQITTTNNGFILDASLSADRNLILTPGGDGVARLWDITTGEKLHEYEGHTGSIWSVELSPDADFVLTGGDDAVAILWETESGTPLHYFTGHEEPINSVTFSPNKLWIATASNDGTARLWDTETGEEVLQLISHQGGVYDVAFSPDSQFVLTGGEDSTVRLWNAETGEEVQRFDGHILSVWIVAFSPDGSRVVTGSFDQSARIWDVETGRVIRQFGGHRSVPRSMSLSSDGHLLLTGDEAGVFLWRVGLQEVIELACAQISGDFSLDERARYEIVDDGDICTNRGGAMLMP